MAGLAPDFLPDPAAASRGGGGRTAVYSTAEANLAARRGGSINPWALAAEAFPRRQAMTPSIDFAAVQEEARKFLAREPLDPLPSAPSATMSPMGGREMAVLQELAAGATGASATATGTPASPGLTVGQASAMNQNGPVPGLAEIIPATSRALTRSQPTARSRPSQRPVLPAFARCPPFHKRSSPALASPHPDLVLSSLLTHTENKKLASCTCAGKGVMPRDTPVLERRDCRSVRQGEAIAGRRVDRLPEHARIQSQPPTQDQAAKCADVTRALRGPWRASAQVWLGRFGLLGCRLCGSPNLAIIMG